MAVTIASRGKHRRGLPAINATTLRAEAPGNNACGRNGGKPLTGPNLQRFLPWTADPADLQAWAQPPPSG
jgi:hypothetical protein